MGGEADERDTGEIRGMRQKRYRVSFTEDQLALLETLLDNYIKWGLWNTKDEWGVAKMALTKVRAQKKGDSDEGEG